MALSGEEQKEIINETIAEALDELIKDTEGEFEEARNIIKEASLHMSKIHIYRNVLKKEYPFGSQSYYEEQISNTKLTIKELEEQLQKLKNYKEKMESQINS